MAKRKKQKTYFSFTEDGIKYMECSVCGAPVRNISRKAVSVLCAICLAPRLFARWNPMEKKQYIKTGRPAGWQWMKEFVDKDGNVFHLGKEQPKLKGTLPPTKVKPKKKTTKRRTKEQILLARAAEKKAALKKAVKKQKDFLNHKFDN